MDHDRDERFHTNLFIQNVQMYIILLGEIREMPTE